MIPIFFIFVILILSNKKSVFYSFNYDYHITHKYITLLRHFFVKACLIIKHQNIAIYVSSPNETYIAYKLFTKSIQMANMAYITQTILSSLGYRQSAITIKLINIVVPFMLNIFNRFESYNWCVY